ncbi:AI-2E family transporter [Halobacillus fulvus]|nr:AI-2E family transporter [Halobacillus fulvus]
MWWKHRYFKIMTGFILLLIAIFLLNKLHVFSPLMTIFSTLFYPILIGGFFFYLLRPIVNMLSKKLPPVLSIFIVFSALTGLISLGVWFLAGKIQEQVNNIASIPEEISKMAEDAGKEVEKRDMGMVSVNEISNRVTQYFGELTQQIGSNLSEVFSAVAGATTIVIIVPIILFFLLKDGDRMIPFLTQWIPEPKKQEVKRLLCNMDDTLSSYIIGQFIVATVDGVLMYIGYLIIGLDYALVLGLFVVVTAIIPFFGPIIGVIPAFVVALMQSPTLGVYVIILLIVVQQLEGNLVAPVVLSNKLDVHPLTIILLLVVAAPLFGFVGMVIAVPLYAVLKVFVKDAYRYYNLYIKPG